MDSSLKNQYWQKVNRHLVFLNLVPFIKYCAVCNNLAFDKIDQSSDIDLFFVIKKGRLFTTRLLITLLLHISGVRRHGNKVAGRFCLSFFIDDSNLDISHLALKNDVFLAYWVYSLVPVIESGNYSNLFLKSNTWILDVLNVHELPNPSKDQVLKDSIFFRFIKFLYIILVDLIFGNLIEYLLRNYQLKRAINKSNSLGPNHGIVINNHVLKFHNIDRRSFYNEKWFSMFDKYETVSKEKFLQII